VKDISLSHKSLLKFAENSEFSQKIKIECFLLLKEVINLNASDFLSITLKIN